MEIRANRTRIESTAGSSTGTRSHRYRIETTETQNPNLGGPETVKESHVPRRLTKVEKANEETAENIEGSLFN